MKNMSYKGRTHKFGDDVNTDDIIAARYLNTTDGNELAKHCMEHIDKSFVKKIKRGDIIAAGRNFGCGSSREQAPQALKSGGFYAVAAKSFARIFYRNAFNIGLLLVECDTDFIDDGDELELDIEAGTLKDKGKGLVFNIKPIPSLMKKLLADGGVVEHFKKHGGFNFE